MKGVFSTLVATLLSTTAFAQTAAFNDAAYEPPGHAPAEPHRFDDCPDGVCERSEPAFPATGEFVESVVDLRVRGRGLDFVWARFYRSQSARDSAQGYGWSHSYDVYIEPYSTTPSGVHDQLLIHPGDGRPGLFSLSAGIYTSPRYRREGTFNPDGSFSLQFADGGQWSFHALDGSVEEGKLDQIVDRNGNAMRLQYDGVGRLSSITDTLGRLYTLTYDAQDRIQAVSDFSGRTVSYTYSPTGDLLTASLPQSTPTPSACDPVTIRTSYTYSSGFVETALNHNLLSITNARGIVAVQNTYAPTTHPSDLQFDRLESQFEAEASNPSHLFYFYPSPGIHGAVIGAIINDAEGRVTEHYYDVGNQLVTKRNYLGFAAPGAQTTLTSNRPSPLPGSPAYAEIVYGYSPQGLLKRILYPDGMEVLHTYLGDTSSGTTSPREWGNRIETRWVGSATGRPCPIPVRIKTWTHLAGFGSDHGEQAFVISETDENGHLTTMSYDGAGNRLNIEPPSPAARQDFEYNAYGQRTKTIEGQNAAGSRKTTVYAYHASGIQAGYISSKVVNPGSLLSQTWTYTYDQRGNRTGVIQPNGSARSYAYDDQDQETLESLEAVGSTSPAIISCRDENLNVVKTVYDNVDCTGAALAMPKVSETTEYNARDQETMVDQEVSPGLFHSRHMQYSPSGLLEELSSGASRSALTDTRVRFDYDSRGLLSRETKAPGLAEESTVEYAYDLNGRPTERRESSGQMPRVTTYGYDCHGRMIKEVDPMGNRLETTFDAVGNPVEQRLYGELVDGVGNSTPVILLSQSTMEFDPLNRLVRRTQAAFERATGAPIGDGQVVETFVYDGQSRVLSHTHPTGGITTKVYDVFNRLSEVHHPNGNLVKTTYDVAGNPIETETIEYDELTGNSVSKTILRVFNTDKQLLQEVDELGFEKRYCYDTLGRLLWEEDELRSSPFGPGNKTFYTYDGRDNLLSIRRAMTSSGLGGDPVVANVITHQTWDGSGRLASRQDARGNTTSYNYDAQSRITSVDFANGQSRTMSYDSAGNLASELDPRGTQLIHSYDLANRRTRTDVFPGAGVISRTTSETFAYDGAGAMVSAINDGRILSFERDSLSRALAEVQGLHRIDYERDDSGRPTRLDYPGGDIVQRGYDESGRLRSIHLNGASVSAFQYQGDLSRSTHLPQIAMSEQATFDLRSRVTRLEHVSTSGGGPLFELNYQWDPAGRRTEEKRSGPVGTGVQQGGYDSMGRLFQSQVAGSQWTDRATNYLLDESGNRSKVVGGIACPGGASYGMSPATAPLNGYASTPCATELHDSAGAVSQRVLASSGVSEDLSYDEQGRLTEILASDGRRLVLLYDALGRNYSEEIDDGAGSVVSKEFIFDQYGQVIEEITGQSAEPGELIHVFADDLDQHILSQSASGATDYYLSDYLNSTVAIVSGPPHAPVIQEVEYDDFGLPFCGASICSSVGSTGSRYLFTGRRWIPEFSLYDFRTRHLDPLVGRFTSLDRAGMWTDAGNMGNGFTYVANAPHGGADPTGMFREPRMRRCNGNERTTVREAIAEAEPQVILAKDVIRQIKRRRLRARRRRWNRNTGQVRDFFGRFRRPRFRKVRRKTRRLHRYVTKRKMDFRCMTGGLCGRNRNYNAWAFPGMKIRLCRFKPDTGAGFFTATGGHRMAAPGVRDTPRIVLHEASHKKTWTFDHRYARGDNSRLFDLARDKPRKAVKNADTYAVWCMTQ